TEAVGRPREARGRRRERRLRGCEQSLPRESRRERAAADRDAEGRESESAGAAASEESRIGKDCGRARGSSEGVLTRRKTTATRTNWKVRRGVNFGTDLATAKKDWFTHGLR